MDCGDLGHCGGMNFGSSVWVIGRGAVGSELSVTGGEEVVCRFHVEVGCRKWELFSVVISGSSKSWT